MPSPIVEIRIPTYQRTTLLRRALNGLLAQTHADWRAVILDDGEAARAIVAEIGDPRLVYRPNPVRLGRERNILAAFARQPMAGGDAFYVLEDDNYVEPTFLADNLGWMAAHDVAVVINNQWHEVPAADPLAGPPRHAGVAANLCHTDGVWTADDFRLALLWCLPMSNGSVFWRRDCRSDFALGSRHHPALHEWMRGWHLADRLYFNATPNVYWYPSEPDPPRHLAGMGGFVARERTLMALRRRLLRELARRGETIKLLSPRFRTPLAEREAAVRRSGGRWPGAPSLPLSRRANLAAKAGALRLLGTPRRL